VSGICIQNGAKWHFSAQILRARDRIAKFVCRKAKEMAEKRLS